MSPTFGILVLEREPASWGYFFGYLQEWLQDGGGFMAVGLAFWVLFSLIYGIKDRPDQPRVSKWSIGSLLLTLIAYGVALVMFLTTEPVFPTGFEKGPSFQTDPFNLALTIAGTIAAVGLIGPFAADLTRLRWRRIWALTRLTFLETVRSRVLWVFLIFMGLFLFPAKWFVPMKAEDELRSTIAIVYFFMTVLMLLFAMALAAFSIPTDIRRQTIHTIVTKPVERFEILLGRFFGYVSLMTVVLLTLTTVSLVLIETTSISEASQRESKRARDPVYGDLYFVSGQGAFEGVSVGREWEYRRYITGGERSPQQAVWSFMDVPSDLAEENEAGVPIEFAFDIFRTTKGQEGRGVGVTFTLITWQGSDPEKLRALEDEATEKGLWGSGRLANAYPPREGDSEEVTRRWKQVGELTKKYGFFQYSNVPITDYETFSIRVPPEIFENALEGEPPEPKEGEGRLPRLRIFVKCETPGQYLGVAEKDLYVLRGDGLFVFNFYKGVFGLWLTLVLVVGLAVAVSTYLNGVISFLLTFLLLLGGAVLRDFILALASGQVAGGGPLEALSRLVQGQSQGTPLDPTPTTRVLLFADQGFLWVLRRVLNVIPDVDRLLSFSDYVAEGFNVPISLMLLNFVFVIGYLLLPILLGYYLLRSREIATW